MQLQRAMQIFFGALMGVVSLVFLIGGIANGKGLIAAGLAVVPLLIGAFLCGIFEWQIRTWKAAKKGVESSVELLAAKLFDAPTKMRPGYDVSVTAGSLAAFVPSESDGGFTADGTFRDARVSVASHVSVAGRQMGEICHTYSHVVVDLLGLSKRFRISKQGLGTKLANVTGIMKDVEIGDKAFDDVFNIDSDDVEFAKSVLDDSIRERIFQVQSQVASVSNDVGHGGMSFVVTNHGLALRWPGDMTVEQAIAFRDLLLDMRERMLEHQSRAAVRVAVANEGAGYRVASDVTPAVESAAEAAVDEEKAARQA